MSDQRQPLVPHPIQLAYVGVRHLSIVARRPPDVDMAYDLGDHPFTVAHTDYDQEDRSLTVWIRMEIGEEDESAEGDTELTDDADDDGSVADSNEPHPFHLIVELAGHFIVDDDQFPVQHLSTWATTNAPMVLLPFLREHVFALTARCGFRPAIVPLVTVPTVRVQGGEVVEAPKVAEPATERGPGPSTPK